MTECNSADCNSIGCSSYENHNMYPNLGVPLSASFSLAFSISTGIIKKLLKTTSNNNNKPNKVVMLARSKLNSIKSKEAYLKQHV